MAVGVAALVALAAVPACSSSSGTKSPDAGSCTWPSGSVAGYALALGRESGVATDAHPVQHDRLLAFDPADGTVVGDCAVEPDQLPLAERATVGGQAYASGPRSYPTAPLPVPTDRPRLVPDNVYRGVTMHGGVRDLADGTVRALSFTGWRVVATSANRLLLTRDAGESDPYRTAPSAWCVLPAAAAARSSCAAFPGATSPGTGGIAPDGTIHWTPSSGSSVTVQGAALTVLRAGDGTVTAAGVGPAATGSELPTGLDQRSIVFLPGVSGPGSRTTLRWLSGSDPASGALRVSSADADTVDQVSDPPFVATAIDGGTHLVTISRSGKVTQYAAGHGGRSVVQLRLPAHVIDLTGLSWPSTDPDPNPGT